jgi:proteasome lid subunit RPN8/RPN11
MLTKTVFLPANCASQMRGWAESRYPAEACGLLIGAQTADSVQITRATSARNLNTERPHDRYLLDPQHFLEIDKLSEGSGEEIVGVWHSHPGKPAEPSATDREYAWSAWSYVIVAVAEGQASDLRSWRLVDEEFVEENLSDR